MSTSDMVSSYSSASFLGPSGVSQSAPKSSRTGGSAASTTSQENTKSAQVASSDVRNDDEQDEMGLFPAIRQLERKGQRIETGHQFLEWLHQVENNLQYQEDASYREYMKQLEKHRKDADNLHQEVIKIKINWI